MASNAMSGRRWLGGAALFLALAMLIVGETWLQNRLSDVTFLLYWLVCFLLTGMAIVVAFMDVRAVARRTREEQRDLMHTTLDQIAKQARDQQQKDQ